MSDGDPTARREFLRMEVNEFFSYKETHEEILERRLNDLKDKNKKRK